MRKLSVLFALVLLSGTAQAQQEAPPPPPMPEEGVVDNQPGGEDLQPEVTITKRGGDTIEEYSAGGQVYMVKITPSKGRPYYLIDSDGDGSLETRRNELDDPEVVKWRIFSW